MSGALPVLRYTPLWPGQGQIYLILCFVDRAFLYNLVNKAHLVHNFSLYVYFLSLHVSGDCVPIIRRNNCIYATHRTRYSVSMTE